MKLMKNKYNNEYPEDICFVNENIKLHGIYKGSFSRKGYLINGLWIKKLNITYEIT